MAGYRAKPPHGCRLNRADPLARGLASAWLFTDRAGDTARNAVDARYDGTLTGSDRGWGYTVDGPFPKLNSATQMMAFASLTSTTTFTIACRFKQKAGGATYQTICTESSSQGFWLRSTGALSYYYGGDHLSTGTVTLNAVTDVVISVSAGALTFYIDGAADASTYSAVPSMGWTRSLNDPGGDSFTGDLHHLQVWVGRALTRADAQALHADPYRHFRRRAVPVPLGVTAAAPAAASNYLTLLGVGA